MLQDERAKGDRRWNAALHYSAQALVAAERGDVQLAADLNRRANQLQQESHALSQGCSARILKRVNQGNGSRGFSQVDLHAMHIREALEHVERSLRELPGIFPGGMDVRFVTGRGAHSEGTAQLKPAVIEMLQERGIKHIVGKGYVEALIEGGE